MVQEKSVEQARLVVMDKLYYQEEDSDPVSLESSFCIPLHTGEQPYIRQLSVDTEWIELEFGWLKSILMVVIQHTGPKVELVQPSEEQRQLLSSLVIELGFHKSKRHRDMHSSSSETETVQAVLRVGLQESVRLPLTSNQPVYIRATNSTKCVVYAFPR